eukprot:1827749-Prymnesium_polylepis.2
MVRHFRSSWLWGACVRRSGHAAAAWAHSPGPPCVAVCGQTARNGNACRDGRDEHTTNDCRASDQCSYNIVRLRVRVTRTGFGSLVPGYRDVPAAPAHWPAWLIQGPALRSVT